MNWYKKAQENWQTELVNLLNELGIKNELDGLLVKVNRDSIILAMNKDENESYEEFLNLINQHFNMRFDYTLKNDDWFWIERIK